jgi:hypothetical protein
MARALTDWKDATTYAAQDDPVFVGPSRPAVAWRDRLGQHAARVTRELRGADGGLSPTPTALAALLR